jgi:hypothetical protein
VETDQEEKPKRRRRRKRKYKRKVHGSPENPVFHPTSGEYNLAACVLIDAIRLAVDKPKRKGAERDTDNKEYKLLQTKAISWIMDTREWGVMSFESVCSNLGIHAGMLRQQVCYVISRKPPKTDTYVYMPNSFWKSDENKLKCRPLDNGEEFNWRTMLDLGWHLSMGGYREGINGRNYRDK